MHVDEQRLLWCLFPEFDVQLARPARRRALRARVASAILPGALRPFPASRARVFDDGLFVTRSPNEERVLAPVTDDAPQNAGPRIAVPRQFAFTSAARAGRAWADAALAAHGRPELRASWHHAVNSAVHELHRWSTIDLTRYRYIAVARQTHPALRALILNAEAQGVPVVYVPHSPLTSFQVDLPVSYALLRGAAERELLAAEAGADPARIGVVGNPSTDIWRGGPAPHDRADAPGVLAVSPDPEPTLRRVIGLLADAGLEHVLVAPHPRSDLAMLRRLLPAGWRLHDGGLTVELLRAGARWVIQCSSGVAWESAALGIPTADVRLDGRLPDYPMLSMSAAIPALSTPEDVRAFVASAPEIDRTALREHARRWCAEDGPDAVANVRAALAGVNGPRPRIVDAWAPDGVLYRRSPLTT